MKKFDTAKIDFHSLRLLVAVHQARSISEAAEQFDMNQSSVSYVIDRLRNSFGDPLFVRVGRSIEPTLRCNEVVKGAQELIRQFERLMLPADFDPSVARDKFVISGNFYERSLILPPLIRYLRAEAPFVRLTLHQANIDGGRQLEAGETDLVISPIVATTSGLYTRKLMDECYACFVDPDSRFAKRGITLEEYAGAQHLLVTYDSGWRPFYFELLSRMGIAIEPSVEVPSFGSIDRLVKGSDLVLTATAGLARVFAPNLACVPAPFDCTFPIQMSWTGRTHSEPSHRWLRNLVIRFAAELAALPPAGGGPAGRANPQ